MPSGLTVRAVGFKSFDRNLMESTKDFTCHDDDGLDPEEEDELPTNAMQSSYEELMGVGRNLFSGWKKEYAHGLMLGKQCEQLELSVEETQEENTRLKTCLKKAKEDPSEVADLKADIVLLKKESKLLKEQLATAKAEKTSTLSSQVAEKAMKSLKHKRTYDTALCFENEAVAFLPQIGVTFTEEQCDEMEGYLEKLKREELPSFTSRVNMSTNIENFNNGQGGQYLDFSKSENSQNNRILKKQ